MQFHTAVFGNMTVNAESVIFSTADAISHRWSWFYDLKCRVSDLTCTHVHLWTAVRMSSKALRAVTQKLPQQLLVMMSQRMSHKVAAAVQVVLMTAMVMPVMQI